MYWDVQHRLVGHNKSSGWRFPEDYPVGQGAIRDIEAQGESTFTIKPKWDQTLIRMVLEEFDDVFP